MYIEASKECNILDFNLAGTVNSKWDIRIIQLHCNSNSLAPVDCTQYYFGQTSGTIHSYNFNGGLHLAKQNQLICIRKEIQMCRICYSTAMGNEDFDISGTIASMAMVGYKVNTLTEVAGEGGTDCAAHKHLLALKFRHNCSDHLLLLCSNQR